MIEPFLLGLTGSIGMGKTTTAAMFADLGCDVWDADEAVFRLYSKGGAAVEPMGRIYPTAVQEGQIQRSALKDLIKQDATALSRIESIVHPLVAQDRADFISASDAEIIVLDIPLLYENDSEASMHAVAVVSTAPEVQKERVLARKTMSEEMFNTILAKQMPDSEKRRRADFVIPTNSLQETREAVANIISQIKNGEIHA